jgi:hypothetical protein
LSARSIIRAVAFLPEIGAGLLQTLRFRFAARFGSPDIGENRIYKGSLF